MARVKYTSKGQRRNCKLHKPAPKLVSGNFNTAIREAFLSAEFTDKIRFSRLGAIVIKAAQVEPKLTQEQAKGWSTKLSFRTFKSLESQGIL